MLVIFIYKEKDIYKYIEMKSFEDWIEIANNIHNNKYKYNKIYKDNKHYYYEVVCNLHGIYNKRISNHINKKQGCPTCAFEKRGKDQRNNNEDFIKKAKEIHGDKYDYSLVDYQGITYKIKIICKIHGEYEQLPLNHFKQNCPNCCKNKPITNETFIKRSKDVHGDKYDYSEVEYINITTPIKIICKTHGSFMQKPREHFDGSGCYKCANRIITTNDFIEKANIKHNNIYNYSKSIYKNARDKIIITCKIHGDFIQSPNDHLNGCGCQQCSKTNFSKIGLEWLESIMIEKNIYIQHGGNEGEKILIRDNKKKYKVDGYCKENNTIYEFHGDIWHGNPKIYDKDCLNPFNNKRFGDLYEETLEKEKFIKDKGYNLITIWEYDYRNK